ncbi:hypothetical protein K504DRAFT_382261 [Pleomassaria siparia CBS 279.74]|uniref:Uncharacterized protein n=1 Tax=Pleomassaria siparia CBS 279.74 TaxID=1314801 RepID=A0A6G1K6F7_9PLEO|nr:hypothetical protein K504DRAFT_382261 [Pleomassaria siparia CBS 279.74]
METQYTPHQQSLLKRSTSIWRRISKRERSSPASLSSPPLPAPTHNQTQDHISDARRTNKLQRRPTQPKAHKNMITHMQRVNISPPIQQKPSEKRPEPITLSTDANRVLATDMSTTPFPVSPRISTVAWNVFLTPAQVFNLVMGFRPINMYDKWFIYSEGPDNSGKLKVHFFSSWTGLKIAELFVVVDLKGLGAGKIVGIKWNGTEQTNGMSEDEAKYMIETTCAWVLNVHIEKGL